MTYRLATEADREKIGQFCKANGQDTPDFGVTFIAEDETGHLIAIANGGLVPYIETVVSKNSTATLIVFSKLEGSLEVNAIGPLLATGMTEAGITMLDRAGYRKSKGILYIKRR